MAGGGGEEEKKRESEKRNKKTNDELAPGQGKNGWMERSEHSLIATITRHNGYTYEITTRWAIECTLYL